MILWFQYYVGYKYLSNKTGLLCRRTRRFISRKLAILLQYYCSWKHSFSCSFHLDSGSGNCLKLKTEQKYCDISTEIVALNLLMTYLWFLLVVYIEEYLFSFLDDIYLPPRNAMLY